MATKNGVTYRQNLVSASMYGTKCPYAMAPKKVTVHETDNNASSNNEVAYMISNGNQTSFHVGIDEKEAVQGIPFNRNAWHAGDGKNGYGNRNTISFEICKNYDPSRGTTNISGAQLAAYNQAKANAVKVIAQVMIEEGINGVVGNVKTHNDWSGKLCPQKMLREGLWIPMRDQIIAEWCRLKNGGQQSTPAPEKPKQEEETTMVCLYLRPRKDGADYYYFDGTNTKHLTHIDQVKVLQKIYKANNGKDMPIMDWTKTGEPWYQRLEQVAPIKK